MGMFKGLWKTRLQVAADLSASKADASKANESVCKADASKADADHEKHNPNASNSFIAIANMIS
jgi:hypothetical protein